MKEGVFWVVGQNVNHIKGGNFQFIYVFDGKRGHSEIWEEIVIDHKELSRFDYEDFPRGRVWKAGGKTIIFINKKINIPSVLQKIVENFVLDGEYKIQEDE